jgi:hypothetical protein
MDHKACCGLTTTVAWREKDATRERAQAALRIRNHQHYAKRQYQSADEAVVGDRGLTVFA